MSPCTLISKLMSGVHTVFGAWCNHARNRALSAEDLLRLVAAPCRLAALICLSHSSISALVLARRAWGVVDVMRCRSEGMRSSLPKVTNASIFSHRLDLRTKIFETHFQDRFCIDVDRPSSIRLAKPSQSKRQLHRKPFRLSLLRGCLRS